MLIPDVKKFLENPVISHYFKGLLDSYINPYGPVNRIIDISERNWQCGYRDGTSFAKCSH